MVLFGIVRIRPGTDEGQTPERVQLGNLLGVRARRGLRERDLDLVQPLQVLPLAELGQCARVVSGLCVLRGDALLLPLKTRHPQTAHVLAGHRQNQQNA